MITTTPAIKDVQLTSPIGRRYLIQSEIGAGGMGVVYQALDRLTGQTVALKRVRTDRLVLDRSLDDSTGIDTTMKQLALAREFTTLAALRHPNIISVLDYGFDSTREPFFTMEYLDRALSLTKARASNSANMRLDLLLQVLQALTYLHRHGILHHDLKPANVLVSGDTAKVVDFGLATRYGDSGEVSGTLAYMAPELFNGEAPSIASDLYAVGVMAYELLAGQHPYADSLVILGKELYSPPDMTQVKAPPEVCHVIERLMARDPGARFRSATETILAFSSALGHPAPVETEAIRESFLQSAPFIGREAEAAQIIGSVEQAAGGHGAAWLIGGESGIGKSRLIEEVSVQALVKGALVLRGQATNAGGSAYEAWREVLCWLILLTELTPLEAGVLGGLFSDLPGLAVKHDFPVPELTAEATRLRLFSVIEEILIRCLAGLQAQQHNGKSQVVVIIIEDLQWAGAGLGLLNRVLALSSHFPVIFLGSYRSDESPDLPQSLLSMHHLLIERLSGRQIAAVSESMLGEAGRDPSVIALLERETEGNLFFLVEVVRTLAEQAGRLDEIGHGALPSTVFSNRLKNAVQARLSRIPVHIRPMLQVAAAIGRQLDTDLLGMIGETETGFNLQSWLLTCADYALIEIHDARWRFTHDKLREGLLDDLAPSLRATVHEKIAGGLEQFRPAAVDNLAYHWYLAGNSLKAREYAGLAGDQAVRSGAFKQAVIYLERALSLEDISPTLDRFAEARFEKRLGEAYLGLDDTRQVRIHLETAARKFGYPLVTQPNAVRLAMIREVGMQLLRRTRSLIQPGLNRMANLKPDMRANLSDVASIYHNHMMSSYFLNDGVTASYTTLRGLNLVESMAIEERKSAAYAGVALVSSLNLPRRISQAYNRLAFESAQRTADSTGKATGLHMVGLVSAGHADWDLAIAALHDSIDYNLAVGDLLRWQYTMNILVEIDYFCGRYAESYARNEESFAASHRYGFEQIETWGYRRRAANLFRQGKVDEAIDWLVQSLPFYEKHTDVLNEANAYGLLASIWLRIGERFKAQDAAGRVSAILGNRAPLGYYLMDAYNGVAEVAFDTWLSNTSNPALRETAHRAARQIENYGRTFRVGEPRAALFRGRYYRHSYRLQTAINILQRGLAVATSQTMPFEQGLLLLELGQYSPDSAVRKTYLDQAVNLFEQLGTPHELALAKSIPAQSSQLNS